MKENTVHLARSALCIACGILLPVLFHMIGLGKAFLPMHIPVLVGGLLLGIKYGLLIGILTPLLSALFTGMPPIAPPIAMAMMCELGVVGALSGLLYPLLKQNIYLTLAAVLLTGRLVWGFLGYLLLPFLGLKGVSLWYPLTLGIAANWPGIVLQFVLIPVIIYATKTRKGSDKSYGS